MKINNKDLFILRIKLRTYKNMKERLQLYYSDLDLLDKGHVKNNVMFKFGEMNLVVRI